MRPFDIFTERLGKGETICLLNEFYEIAIKCLPGTTRYIAKSKGGREYGIESSTDLVQDTFDALTEITQEQFDDY